MTDGRLVDSYLRRWRLRRDGPPRGGVMATAYPVRCRDGTTAVLKVQPVDEETAGEPGFELYPALRNRWDEVAAGDITGAVHRRFDRMTEVLALDRQRAAAWTLARVLQDVLWKVEDGAAAAGPEQRAIAQALLPHPR